MPDLLIIRAGRPEPTTRRALGGFDDWFIEALGAPAEVTPASGVLPDPRRYGGIIITGSLAGVGDPLPWIVTLGRWALGADQHGVPVLGVCFGHQLLARALGGTVGPSPAGPEVGTTHVHLTPEGRSDPLFNDLPSTLSVQETHGDAILKPPPGAVRLAGSEHTVWQAMRAGHALRGVQFHPEMRARHTAAVASRWATSPMTWDSVHGRLILQNWLRHFVRRGQ